jgi:hypothetical protein
LYAIVFGRHEIILFWKTQSEHTRYVETAAQSTDLLLLQLSAGCDTSDRANRAKASSKCISKTKLIKQAKFSFVWQNRKLVTAFDVAVPK